MMNGGGQVMSDEDYRRGYGSALADIYAALDSDDHPRECGPCRVCGVIQDVISDVFLKLGNLLSEEDFNLISRIIQKLNQ